MAALVLAGVLGLLGGGGPMARGEETDASGTLRVAYDRFAHLSAPGHLLVSVVRAQSKETRLWIARDFIGSVRIERITPEPARVETHDDRLVFVFHTTVGHGFAASFRLHAEELGVNTAALGIEGGAALRFKQIVYP